MIVGWGSWISAAIERIGLRSSRSGTGLLPPNVAQFPFRRRIAKIGLFAGSRIVATPVQAEIGVV